MQDLNSALQAKNDTTIDIINLSKRLNSQTEDQVKTLLKSKNKYLNLNKVKEALEEKKGELIERKQNFFDSESLMRDV